jgi:hypothetical protein
MSHNGIRTRDVRIIRSLRRRSKNCPTRATFKCLKLFENVMHLRHTSSVTLNNLQNTVVKLQTKELETMVYFFLSSNNELPFNIVSTQSTCCDSLAILKTLLLAENLHNSRVDPVRSGQHFLLIIV